MNSLDFLLLFIKKKVRKEENSKFVQPNFVKELIEKYFKQPSPNPKLIRLEKAEYYSSTDILQELIFRFGNNHKDLTTLKIGRELSKLNIETKVLNGIKRYKLIKKENFEIAKEKEVEFDELEDAV